MREKRRGGASKESPRTKSVERSQALGEAFLLGKCGLVQAMVVEAIHRRVQINTLAQSAMQNE